MAEEAHKEPTMEEILASIRKIISEDDDTKSAPPAANELRPDAIREQAAIDADEGLSLDALASETDAGDDMFEEFDLSDLAGDAGEGSAATAKAEDVLAEALTPPEPEAVFEDTLDEAEDLVAPEPTEPEVAPAPDAAPVDPVELVEDDFDEFDVPETAFEAPPEPEFAPEPELEAEVPVTFASDAPSPSAPRAPANPAATEEPPMQGLTEHATEAAAAGALAKLVAKMDLGSENTLEGMVRELLKPMIKEWLDAHLPAIVEDKVEAEVQRIARLAR